MSHYPCRSRLLVWLRLPCWPRPCYLRRRRRQLPCRHCRRLHRLRLCRRMAYHRHPRRQCPLRRPRQRWRCQRLWPGCLRHSRMGCPLRYRLCPCLEDLRMRARAGPKPTDHREKCWCLWPSPPSTNLSTMRGQLWCRCRNPPGLCLAGCLPLHRHRCHQRCRQLPRNSRRFRRAGHWRCRLGRRSHLWRPRLWRRSCGSHQTSRCRSMPCRLHRQCLRRRCHRLRCLRYRQGLRWHCRPCHLGLGRHLRCRRRRRRLSRHLLGHQWPHWQRRCWWLCSPSHSR